MSVELIFMAVLVVLAVLLFGVALMVRSGRKTVTESSGGPQGVGFKDCYDLGSTEAGRSSETYKTMCSTNESV